MLIQNYTMAQSTTESWETYIANYENSKPGTTVVRMDLINNVPIKKYDIILVTGLIYKSPDESGFPDSEQLKQLQDIEDKLVNIVSSKFESIYVGSFMHDSKRRCYFYLKDSTQLRNTLESFYAENSSNFKNITKIEGDKDWEYYKEFLYPNEDIRNYLADEKVVQNLIDSGDKLEKARQVDHWSFFKTKQDAEKFSDEIKNMGYDVEKIEKLKDKNEYPFIVNFSKNEHVDLNSIYKITTNLRLISTKFGGDYDGWETFIIKE